MTESPMPSAPVPGGPEPTAPATESVTQRMPPSRTIKPAYLVAGGVAALVAAGGLAYVLLGSSGSSPTPPMALSSPKATASASVQPSGVVMAPVALATRNPFTTKATGAAGTGSTAAASTASAATVTDTTTQRTTVTQTVNRTTTATTTTTVSETATYVFVADVNGAQATLVVNDSVPVVVGSGNTTSGVTFVEADPGDATCAMVKLTGTSDATAVSVCEGRSAKLG